MHKRLSAQHEDPSLEGHARVGLAVLANEVEVDDVLAVAVRDEAAAGVRLRRRLVEDAPWPQKVREGHGR